MKKNRCSQGWSDDSGYCGTCALTGGVDEKRDVCICEIDDPHKDWRFRNNERCPVTVDMITEAMEYDADADV